MYLQRTGKPFPPPPFLIREEATPQGWPLSVFYHRSTWLQVVIRLSQLVITANFTGIKNQEPCSRKSILRSDQPPMKELSSSISLYNPVHFLKLPAKNSRSFISIFHRTAARKLQGGGNSVPRFQRKPWPKAIISLALAYDFPENIYSQIFNSISPYLPGCVS